MKNLTQLPWSGKGSKAKNDNTLGRMRGGIRSRIGSMSLKNTSLFGVILALLLTFGVGEMWGGPTFSGGYAYFYNKGNWSDNYKQLCIGKDSYTETRSMTAIDNTKLWYNSLPTSGWGDATYMAVMGNSSNWGSGSWGPSNLSNANHRTGTVSLGNWGFSSGNVNMLTPANSNNDATLTLTYIGNAYSSLNNTITVKAKISTDGGSSYSAGNTPGKLTASSYKFTSYTSCASATSATVNAGSASSTISVGYTANLTLTAVDVEGYDFIGWSSGTNASTNIGTTKSVTVNPTAATTYYAWYREKRYTAYVQTYTNGSASPTSSSNKMGQITGGAITATPNTGYRFNGWTLNSGTGTFADASATSTTFYPTSDSQLRANFVAKNYTVTLDKNGGDSNGSIQTTYNSSSTSSFSGASRAGYSCDGYYTDPSTGSKIINADGTLVSGTVSDWLSSGYWVNDAATITLYAHWTASLVQYTLTFNARTADRMYGSVAAVNTSTSATLTSGENYDEGTGVTATATPTNVNYKFDSWYDAASGGSKIGGAGNPYVFTLSANTAIYAHFVQKTTVITLNANGGSSGSSSVTATHGSNSLPSFTNPSRDGYTFAGWYTAAGSSTKVINANQTFASSSYVDASGWTYDESTLTLYAHWTEKKSTITVTTATSSQGTLKFGSTDKSWGTTASLGVATTQEITATAAAGFTFVRWDLSGAAASASTLTNATITLKADGSGSTGTATAVFAEDLSSPWIVAGGNKIVTTGTTWRTTADANNTMLKETGHSTESVVYFTVPVTTICSGDNNGNFQFKIYNTSTSTWYSLGADGSSYYLLKAEDGTAKSLVTGGKNIELRAYVTGNYEFKLDYSTSTPKLTVTWPVFNQVRISAASPTDATNTGNFDLSDPVSNVRTVTRSLKANTTYTFKIMYNSDWYGYNSGTFTRNSSTSSNSRTISTSGGDMTLTTDYAGDYTFRFNQSTNALSVDFPTAYKVTYGKGTVDGSSSSCSAKDIDNGNAAVTSNSTWVKSGNRVVLTAPVAKTGYTYNGWFDNNSGTGTAITTNANCTITVTSALTRYACYSINNHAITHSASTHGSYTIQVGSAAAVSTNTTSDYGKTITLAATPATGYHLGSWSAYKTETPATTVTVTDNKFTMPDYAVTVGATFTPNTYTVQFHRNGGAGDVVYQNFTYDVAQNLTANSYTRTGYTFAGWATSASGEVVYADGAEVSNLTAENDATFHLYAKWNAKQCTINFDFDATDPGHGSHASATTSTTATYAAAMTSVTPPTAANGWAFMGYFDAADGEGTQYYTSTGASARAWDKNTESPTTLYAYYKKAEITSITFDPGTVVENNSSVSVTATISPTPTGTTTICWRVLHNDTGNPLDPQPTFTPSAQGTSVSFTSPNESGMYKVEAVLHTGSGCAGTDLDTREATFQVAGSHTVTVAYKYSGTTIKASTSVTGRPLAWSDEITAPDIFGYSFSSWSAGDGITITDDNGASSKTSSSSATIKIKATYNGTLTANYTPKKLIYFKNTLGWSNVYVNFYKSDYWNSDKGSGNNGVPVQNKAMTRYGETDIWYYDYGSDNFTGYTNTKPTNYVSFTSATQSSAENFWASGTGISVSYPARRSDDLADKSGETGFYESTPMFVPLAGQSAITKNNSGGGKALYYNSGYWTKFLPGTGYTLEIYNADGNSKIKEMDFSSADELMPMKAVVDLEANTTYKFQIKRHGDVYLGNSGSMSYANHGQATPWEMTSTGFSMCGIATTAAGNYTFNFTYSANASNQYRLRISVDYPVANGDYRLIYTDNTRNSGTRYKPSAIVNKENNGTAIVSFFVRHNNSPVLRIQQATVDNSGNITWKEYPTDGTPTNQITGSIASAITKDTVYNFNLSMNGSGALSVSSVEYYSGNYYIRTDAANSKWDNYRTDPDHLMTYSEYSITHGGYSHYYTHWVNKDEAGRKNVKFCIANDYSPCISDTLARETASGAWAHIADWMEEGGDLKRSANVRFMWDIATNTISRAYVDGAQEDGSEFLLMLNTDSPNKIKWADETALTSNKVTFSDNGNWIYETNIKAQPNAKIKLKSTWGNTGNAIVQYFKGTSSEDETLIGGSGTGWYDFRLIYDFKTNRLVASYVPTTGTISSDVSINADVMFIREHQGDIAQLTFSGSGKISKINTAYGVMRFSKWTLNNKAKAEPHSPLGTELSRFERDIFYISFPFRVNLEEVFGFGTYGTHWIIEEYDGAERASKGFWAETETFWKFITNRRGKFLEPNTGYILALDLDELGESSSVWANTDVVELYFPSYGMTPNITASSVTHELPEHACTIGPRFSGGDDRRMKDSHWNVMSVPTYINTDDVTFANTDWITTKTATTVGPQFLYTWNMNNNTLTATSGTSYTYKAMHAYMVQYCGYVTWETSVSPALAPRHSEDAPTDVEFRLELQQDEQKADQAFIKLSYDEHVTTGFDFNYDLNKEMNGGQANVYTMITSVIDNEASLTEAAGNVLPMSEQTTVVPVGVKIAADGDYTFAIPDGTEGVGVTLIDQETGIRTSLSALAYTVSLEAGTYDERFVLEISPIHNVPTEQSAVRDQQSDVRKVLIDGLLYIVRDNKMYDARGAMIMEK